MWSLVLTSQLLNDSSTASGSDWSLLGARRLEYDFGTGWHRNWTDSGTDMKTLHLGCYFSSSLLRGASSGGLILGFLDTLSGRGRRHDIIILFLHVRILNSAIPSVLLYYTWTRTWYTWLIYCDMTVIMMIIALVSWVSINHIIVLYCDQQCW